MIYRTNPLRGETEPLRTLNTHNHYVALMENNCRCHMLIRVSLYMNYHSQPLRGQTEPLRKHNTHKHCLTLMKTTVGAMPYLYKGFPFIWLLIDCLYPYFSLFYRPLWAIGIKPHFYKGFPFIWLFIDCLHPCFLYILSPVVSARHYAPCL